MKLTAPGKQKSRLFLMYTEQCACICTALTAYWHLFLYSTTGNTADCMSPVKTIMAAPISDQFGVDTPGSHTWIWAAAHTVHGCLLRYLGQLHIIVRCVQCKLRSPFRKAELTAIAEVCQVVVSPTQGLKERTFDSSAISAVGLAS